MGSLTMKTQLSEAMLFLDNISNGLKKIPNNVNLRLKINIISFRSNAVRFKLQTEQLRKLDSLGIEIEYEFMT